MGIVLVVLAASQQVSLDAGSMQALAQLRRLQPKRPAPLFLFTDPNKDPDDLCTMVIIKDLQDHGFIDLRCVVTTLGDHDVRTHRAKFAKSVLEELGLTKAKVGVGVDYSIEVVDAHGVVDSKGSEGRERDHRVFVETPLVKADTRVETDGLGLLKMELSGVLDHSAVLVVNAGLTDLAALLREIPEVVKQKTAKVAIMGGVEPKLDQNGFVVADQRAYNNKTDQPSADFAYRRLQELGVPLLVVNKESAYEAAVTPDFYTGMAATGNSIGIYLKSQQFQSLKHLWEGISQGDHQPGLTPAWFFQTFTDADLDTVEGKGALSEAVAHPDDFDRIWKQVSKFNLYDPITLLVATPGVEELFFEAEVPRDIRSDVRIVGKNSIKDPRAMKDLISGLAIESLTSGN